MRSLLAGRALRTPATEEVLKQCPEPRCSAWVPRDYLEKRGCPFKSVHARLREGV